MPEAIIQSKLFAQIPGIEHGFTTRAASTEQIARLEARVSTAKQVHKDQIFWPVAYERRTHEADAVGTLRGNFFVGAYSADCTPLLLAVTENGMPIGVMAVHAGWRGTALEIARKSVGALLAKCGKPGKERRLYAVIGPCIGYENFEVGDDVIAAFPHALADGLARPLRLDGDKQKYLFHLPGENLRQLRLAAAESGLPLEAENLALCTVADPGLFPSFRRDHEHAGRILSYIAFGTDRP
ncbi:MAG: polyphenol oxidase family protein [Bacteriovoracia bacterium]